MREPLVLWPSTIPDPLRPSLIRICKLGVAGWSPARSTHEAPANAGAFDASDGNAAEAVSAKCRIADRARLLVAQAVG